MHIYISTWGCVLYASVSTNLAWLHLRDEEPTAVALWLGILLLRSISLARAYMAELHFWWRPYTRHCCTLQLGDA